MAWQFETPDPWLSLSRSNRKMRGELSSDQCVLDDNFFVRGLVEIPVVDSDEVFAWGVWVSLSRANFGRARLLWQAPNRVAEPSYFGWLCNFISLYPETLHLKTAVLTRSVGTRPYVELEPTDHPLSQEQRNGITRSREVVRGLLKLV
jgi:hypothetical protein